MLQMHRILCASEDTRDHLLPSLQERARADPAMNSNVGDSHLPDALRAPLLRVTMSQHADGSHNNTDGDAPTGRQRW